MDAPVTEPPATSRGAAQVHPKVAEIPGLTTLRFVPALYIVLYHYLAEDLSPGLARNVLSLGYTSVTFFFILSGFILAYNYSRVDFTVSHAKGRFYSARIARIFPVYWFTLFLGLGPFVFNLSKGLGGPLIRHLHLAALGLAPLGLQSWVPGSAMAINFPSWSISTECFFYFCFPFLLPRILAAPERWLRLTIALWAAGNLLAWAMWSRWGTPGLTVNAVGVHDSDFANILAEFLKFFPPLRLPEFMFGILTYTYWRKHRTSFRTGPLLAAATVGGVALLMIAPSVPVTLMNSGLSAIVWVPVILAGTLATSPLITSPFSLMLGRISFALYLFHGLCLQYIGGFVKRVPVRFLTPGRTLALELIAAFTLAWAAHIWIEEGSRRKVYLTISRRLGVDQ